MNRDVHTDGFLLSKKVVDVSAIEAASEDAGRLFEFAHAAPGHPDVYWRLQGTSRFLEKIEPVIDKSDVLKSMASASRLLALAASAMNDSGTPFLVQDKLVFKVPGQDGYPLHQDYNWWHDYQPVEICTIAIAISDVTEINGCLWFFAGRHKSPILPAGENRALSEQEVVLFHSSEPVPVPMESGDALAFHSLAPHFSERNMHSSRRLIFFGTYCASHLGDRYAQHVSAAKQRRRLEQSSNEYR
jgi:2-aminoethylphosphonate dioxygenase